jgi:hypothetical protein
MTNEELDKARANKAWEIRYVETKPTNDSIAQIAARLAREGWTPPPPVDPDVLAYREWESLQGHRDHGEKVLAGEWDQSVAAIGYLAGARMAREQEQERAKALEAGVSDAIAYVEFQRPNAVDLDQLLLALRNLLKGADQ